MTVFGTLDREQHDEILGAIEVIALELKRLVQTVPGQEQTAMVIGTNLATIQATLQAACNSKTD